MLKNHFKNLLLKVFQMTLDSIKKTIIFDFPNIAPFFNLCFDRNQKQSQFI
jgi:hypothetical protein